MSDRDAYQNPSNNEQPGSSNGSGPGSFNGSHHFGINRASFYDFQNFHYHAGDVQSSIQGQSLEKLRQAAWMGAAHDSAERFPPPKCEPGTRDDVLQSLKEWAGGYLSSSQCRIAWAHGSEFSGKSAIAQTLADHLQRHQKLGASFFFPDKAIEQNLIRSFVPTIAYQLYQNIPVLRSGIVHALNEDAILSKAIDVQIKRLLLDPFHELQTPLDADVVILVDGLDKCESKAVQRGIILPLACAALDDARIRLIIFSRSEQQIYDSFHDQELVGAYMSIDLDKDYPVEQSIRTYLRAGFNSIYTARGDVMKTAQLPWPTEVDLNVLVEKSCRHFCCAAAILRIARAGSINPIEQLDRLLDMEPPELDPHLKSTSPTRLVSPSPHPHQSTETYQQRAETHTNHSPAYRVQPSDMHYASRSPPPPVSPSANFNTAQFVNSQVGGIYPGSSGVFTPVVLPQTRYNSNIFSQFLRATQAQYRFGSISSDAIDSILEPYIQNVTAWQNERRLNPDGARDAAKIQKWKDLANSTLDKYRSTIVGLQSILPMQGKVDALNRADEELQKVEPDWMTLIGLIKIIAS